MAKRARVLSKAESPEMADVPRFVRRPPADSILLGAFAARRATMSAPITLALFEPDIPQNAGTLLRLAACLDVPVAIIEPCGFVLGDRRLRRAGMDYLDRAQIVRFSSWRAFEESRTAAPGGRLIVLTTRGEIDYARFRFRSGDVLLVGRESAGVPDRVRLAADARLRIPIAPGLRSLNVAVAAAMVVGEALRQLGAFPGAAPASGP
jgi:tRNA (cytidine/uridine-2'-O-)-methyltransferase